MDQARTVPEAGLPPLTAGNVGACPPTHSAVRQATRPAVRGRVRSRSAGASRRNRTVSAYREGDRTVVLIPARMSEAEERRWVNVMLDKLAAQESKRILGDAELAERAERLSTQYFDGRARPTSVRWVTNQNTRWGSCTPVEGSIRLSHRLQGMPEYVVDYVLVHELAHLLVPGHGPRFWRLLEAYPAPNGPAVTSKESSRRAGCRTCRPLAESDIRRSCTETVPTWLIVVASR